MKKAIFTFILAAFFLGSYGQMYNDGGTITVQNGASLVIQGDYTSSNNGDITIGGTVDLKGDFINNGGAINSASAGLLKFSGTTAQEITGDTPTTFYCDVQINNSNGVALKDTETGSDQTILGEVDFTSGKFILNNFNLTLGSVDPVNFGTNKYFVTNLAGALHRTVGGGNVVFPVGNTSFNPVTLNNAGTSDTYSVVAKDGAAPSWSGTEHFVNRHWEVAEAVAGGSNLSVTPQWTAAQEQTGFDRTDCAVGVSTDDGATFAWAPSGAASGSDPYTRSGAGFDGTGTFMVGDYFFEGLDLDLQVLLGGPYSGSGQMSKVLNDEGYLPLTDPYGLSTTVQSIPTNAVDWVKLELRDKNDMSSTVNSYAKFIDINGNLIFPNESSGVKLKGLEKDDYYLAITHRNHLGIISSQTVSWLNATDVAYDFTSSQDQAYQHPDIVSNNAAMKSLSQGKFGLYEGDANGDGWVYYNGIGNDRDVILNTIGNVVNNYIQGYSPADFNLDGWVYYNGIGNDRDILLNVIGPGTVNNYIQSHLP